MNMNTNNNANANIGNRSKERECTMQNRYDSNSFDTSNPAPRCPVILLLDTSSSMSGRPIEELNQGLCQFIQETAEDEAASMSVELEIISFDDAAKVVMPFTPIADVRRQPEPLRPRGMTSMGKALRLAHEHLQNRRLTYRQNGVSSYRPWVVLMTDGAPNDDWETAAADMRRLGEQNKIQYIGIEVGDRVDHDAMLKILPAQPGPVRLNELRFRQFFRWLTDSLKSVSTSTVSDQDNVKLGSIRSWADLTKIES